ncbi:hypothetical protein [Streptomyces sp. B4I13]|uniref:MmyB family transcriptional regulator n=1 Tax=Streptomyces sp. B4I13 TaxID=3042271 RepID=UPI003593E4E8
MTGEVAAHREDHKTIDHPSVGPVAVDCDVLNDGDSELKIVIMTAVPGSEDETRLRLTAIAGPPHPHTPDPTARRPTGRGRRSSATPTTTPPSSASARPWRARPLVVHGRPAPPVVNLIRP